MKDQLTERYALTSPYDLRATFRLLSMGTGDPTLRLDNHRIQLALTGPHGPISVTATVDTKELVVHLSGEDDDWLRPKLPGLFGLDFDVPTFDEPRRLATVSKRLAGMRLPRLPLLFPRLVQIILQQLINFQDESTTKIIDSQYKVFE